VAVGGGQRSKASEVAFKVKKDHDAQCIDRERRGPRRGEGRGESRRVQQFCASRTAAGAPQPGKPGEDHEMAAGAALDEHDPAAGVEPFAAFQPLPRKTGGVFEQPGQGLEDPLQVRRVRQAVCLFQHQGEGDHEPPVIAG